MTKGRRLLLGAALGLVAVFGSGGAAAAHGGGAVTSNYRIVITDITPSVPGLTAAIVDATGSVEVTWHGSGTLVIIGYEGEPYVRIGPGGVDRNVHSPATYLNQDRYARVALPAAADAKAAPEWQYVGTGTTFRWHDHRTHWMDPVAPEQVRAQPGRTFVINPRWLIPLSVDGTSAAIAGSLTWVPVPASAPYAGLAGVLAVVVGASLFAARWRRAALVVAILGTTVFCLDSVSYLRGTSAATAGRMWYIAWPAAAVVAIAVLAARLRAKSVLPPAALSVVGVVLAAVGGVDRLDAVGRSQVFAAAPDWTARTAAIVCLVTGLGLVARHLAVVVPVAFGRGQWWQPQAGPQPPPRGIAGAGAASPPDDAPTLANTDSRRTAPG